MNRVIVVQLYFCLISSSIMWAQTPIRFRVSTSLCGILFGRAARIDNLRENIDDGQ